MPSDKENHWSSKLAPKLALIGAGLTVVASLGGWGYATGVQDTQIKQNTTDITELKTTFRSDLQRMEDRLTDEIRDLRKDK